MQVKADLILGPEPFLETSTDPGRIYSPENLVIQESRLLSTANPVVYDNVKESRRHEFGSVRERRSREGRHGGGRDNHDGVSGRSSYSRTRHVNNTGSLKLKKDLLSKSVDYSDMDTVREGEKSDQEW